MVSAAAGRRSAPARREASSSSKAPPLRSSGSGGGKCLVTLRPVWKRAPRAFHLSPCGLRRAHKSNNIFLAMSESSLIPCIAVHKDDRIDGRDGLVSRSLWRCATGQKGALLLQ